MRIIRHILDNSLSDFGRKLALIPLEDKETPVYATVYEETFWELLSNNCPDFWFLDKDNIPCIYISELGRNIAVSRIIMRAGPGQGVRLKDKDKYNLRTDNLYFYKLPSAKRREFDYLTYVNRRCWDVYEYQVQNNWQIGVNQLHERRQALEKTRETENSLRSLIQSLPSLALSNRHKRGGTTKKHGLEHCNTLVF